LYYYINAENISDFGEFWILDVGLGMYNAYAGHEGEKT
jgi:hypothetical protein